MAEDEPSKMDTFKDKLSDIGQKVGEVSKKAATKTSEVSANIAEDIKLGARKVSDDVKVGAQKVSETVGQKREEFLEKREETKKAKAEADDAREEELRSVLESTDLIPISRFDEVESEIESQEEIEKLTVNQLKSRLSDLGLKVSGKKSELVGRLKESFDSTKEKITEIRSFSNMDEEENVIEEIVTDESIIVNPNRLEKNVINRKMRYAINWLNRAFFGYYLVLSLSVMGFFSSVGILEEFDILGNRFIQDYGGMEAIWVQNLQFIAAACLLLAGLFYLFGRVKNAAMLSVLIAIFSYLYRFYFAFESDAMNEFAIVETLIDFVALSVFCVTSAVPWFFVSDLENVRSQDYSIDSELKDDEIGQELISATPDEGMRDMDQFAVTRPTPPRRRRPMELFYEGTFLLIGMILWPITISTHFLLALEIPTRFGTWSMEGNALTLLVPLYLLSFLATWVVIRSDREARGGALYAKEKEAYHEFMNQFLALKKAYYERQAKRLDVDDSE